MSDDFTVRGAEQFLALSKRLKAAGEKELRKELNKALREATKPLTPKTRAAAQSRIPSRGGLAARVTKAPQRVAVKTGTNPGVSLIVSPRRGSGARLLDVHGAVRHPVFGNDEVWVRQEVPDAKGWFSDTVREHAPQIRDDLAAVLDDFTRKVVG